jgi:DNA-binding response OmpR family regulator
MQKILIIEDEAALLSMLSNKLMREGYDVASSHDGEEGLARVRSEKPDLVLLDIVMPKMSGIDVLEKMHADKELSKIPVIIISNSGQPVEIERAKALGAIDYLVKTEFDPQEVVEKVRAVLGAPNSGPPTNPAPPARKANIKSSGQNLNDKGASVLVVEDDQFLRDLIVKKLEEEGLRTMQAIDGEEGLRVIRENKPDIILLDLILPGIDGFEVLKQTKADPAISGIPIVILSNLGQKDDVGRGMELGAKDYLIKAHFTPGEIVQKVKEILG